MARALILHNPAARNAPGPVILGTIRRKLVLAGFDVELQPSLRAGDLIRLAAGAEGTGYERVVVCGGDGSVREVAQGLNGSHVPLAIIPLGTTNVLAREMGLPHLRPLACASIAAGGRVRDVGIGAVNGHAFTFCASAGPDSVGVARVNLQAKSQLGGWAYIHAAMRGLLDPGPPELQVLLPDGTRLDACMVFAAKSRRYGGSLTISRGASLEAPDLRLIVVSPPVSNAFRAIPYTLRGGIEGAPGITWSDVTSFELRSHEPCPVQADGDLVTTTPAVFASKASALRLVFPC